MDNKVIGYIINESAIPGFTETNIIGEDKPGRLIGEGILQTANETNRNGRFYPSEELFPQLVCPRTMELLEAGYLRAELGHPLSTQLVRQQTIDDSRTCAQFLKLWTDGDNVWGRFRGTNNPFGDAFNKDLQDGCKPAWSLRALGTIEKTNRGAEVRNLKLITWDQVIYPSHPAAYTHNLITEGATFKADNQDDTVKTHVQRLYESLNNTEFGDQEMLSEITHPDVVDLLRAKSNNVKAVTEIFGYAYKSITPTATGVTMKTNDGDTLFVNLENYVRDEIMNYCSELQK